MNENAGRVGDEREDGHENEQGDDECADGVRDAHIVVLNEKGGNDHAHTSQCICQHVQEDATHVIVLRKMKETEIRGDRDHDGHDNRDRGANDHAHGRDLRGQRRGRKPNRSD